MMYLPSVVTVARCAVVVAVLLVIAVSVQSCRLADRDAELAVRTAERMGWTRDSGRPTIPDLPPGIRPIATVSGGVIYLPVTRRPAPAPVTLDAPQAPAGGGCDLEALEATLDCRAEVARAGTGTVAIARLWVRGLLRDGDRSRELPWHRVGDTVPIRLPDGGEQPVVTDPPEVKVTLPSSRRWWAAVRAGVSDHPEVVVGGSVGKGKWGAWVDWRRAADRETWAGGVEWRW